ncbi:hypothetical protein [Pontibacter sp. G13]|uniref:hypothetical protein n=1 Tax=Pontibacter sp. G13 TaxID=3074898 RepID=UPI00288A0805|nr:hypothetical protein [Pontibacter sp. G13]WNJ15991.1 hypothetical protein RJD25_14100 [Pontibacter sp. G13]
MRNLILASSLAMILAACQPSNYQAYQEFDGACWQQSDTLWFELPESPTTQLSVSMQIEADYGYQNIYLLAGVKGDSGMETVVIGDTLISPTGDWLLPLSGNQATVEIPTNLPNSSKTGAKGFVTQYMRTESLCHIRSVGVEIASGVEGM